jgi:nitrilase
MNKSLTVAVLQGDVTPDRSAMLSQTERMAAEARARGASLMVLPETWLPGYPAWLDVCRDAGLWNHPPVKAAFASMAEASVTVPGPVTDALAGIARTSEAVLVAGVIERIEAGPGSGTLYNSLLVFGPDGALLNHHRKLVPTYTERMVWGPGDPAGLRAVDTPAGRVGGLICWEHWMPLARQAMHESGEDVHAALWPTVHEMHQVASRHYAFEGRCFVLAAGSVMRAAALPAGLEPHPDRVSGPEQLVLRGGSAIIAPDGRYLAGPVYDRAEVLVACLDLSERRAESMTLDVTGHYARPDVFDFSVRRASRPR